MKQPKLPYEFQQLIHPLLKSLLEIVTITLAVISITLSVSANQTAEEGVFNNRMVQPLIYAYDLQTDTQSLQHFTEYPLPTVTCTIDFFSGWATQLSIINSDNGIESIYQLDTKVGIEPVEDAALEFAIPFNAFIEHEGYVYQYAFIYLESADHSWELDCILARFDFEHGTGNATILGTTDILRLEYSADAVRQKVLEDYWVLYDKIEALSM